MGKSATAAPVLPGQDPKTIVEMFSSRLDEYRASRARAGITMERVYLMDTPMGSFLTVYVEADGDANEAMRRVIMSDLAIDRDFVAGLARVHGITFDPANPMPPPEILGDWADAGTTARKRGLGFCAPVIPGRSDAGRSFSHEAFVTRAAELTESRLALGQSREVVVLNQTPMGDIVCVYLEGDDPVDANRRFSASTGAYDTWFKQQLSTIFPAEVAITEPLPPIEEIWDWQRATANV